MVQALRRGNCLSRKLFVHVGPNRTATTAIQDFLGRPNNSTVVYPKLDGERAGAHHGLVRAFFGSRGAGRTRDQELERLLSKMDAEASRSERDVIISSEALVSEWKDIGPFVRELITLLRVAPADVEIIVACREHFARAASCYNKKVRAFGRGERSLPDQFLASQAARFCYAPLIGRLRRTGFKVTTLNYHPSENWTDRFLVHIGFPPDKLPKIRTRLASVGPKALIANLAANKAFDSKQSRMKFRDEFRETSDRQPSSYFIFSRDCARKVDELFGEDRKFLESECNIRLNPPDLEIVESAFFISATELDEIVSVARKVGREKRIAAFARRYVKDVIAT